MSGAGDPADGPPAPALRLTGRRVRELGRPFRSSILATTALGVAATGARIGVAALVAAVLTRVLHGHGGGRVAPLLVAIGALGVASAALSWGRGERARAGAGRVRTQLRLRLFDTLVGLGPGRLVASRTGAVEAAMGDGVDRLAAYLADVVPLVGAAAAGIAIVVVWVTAIDVLTGLVLLGAAVVVWLAPVVTMRAFGPAGRRLSEALGRTAAEYLDAIQGLLTLKTSGAAGRWERRLRDESQELAADSTSLAGLASMHVGFVGLGMAAGTVLGVALAATRAAHHRLAGSAVLTVAFLAMEGFRPLGEVQAAIPLAYDAVAGANAVVDLLDEVPAVPEPAGPVAAVAAARASVSFEGVTFRYADGRRPALDAVSFDIAPGETVALVGPSGAGKSTVLALILRHFDPQEGVVRIGGHDVRQLARRDRHTMVSVLFQDPYLMAGTVRDNLLLARPGATGAEVDAAARAANAHAFVTALPDGYDTVIGERGAGLSGGERRRLALARALLAGAPVLVLDEPTAGVDAASEALIDDALTRLGDGRTVIVLAHDASHVAAADRVIALDGGHVVRVGGCDAKPGPVAVERQGP